MADYSPELRPDPRCPNMGHRTRPAQSSTSATNEVCGAHGGHDWRVGRHGGNCDNFQGASLRRSRSLCRVTLEDLNNAARRDLHVEVNGLLRGFCARNIGVGRWRRAPGISRRNVQNLRETRPVEASFMNLELLSTFEPARGA